MFKRKNKNTFLNLVLAASLMLAGAAMVLLPGSLHAQNTSVVLQRISQECTSNIPDRRTDCVDRIVREETIRQCTGSVDRIQTCSDNIRDAVYPARVNGDGYPVGNLEADCSEANLNKENCGIVAYLVLFTRFLAGIVGIVVAFMIAYRGVQYTVSKDDPQKTQIAKEGIRDAIIWALIPYLLIFSFLQWLIPGGLF